MLFYEALQIPKGLTAIIGGGGKTALLVTLGRELSRRGRVLLCATARMYPPSDVSAGVSADIPLCVSPDAAALEAAFLAGSPVCVGDWADGGKLTLDRTPMGMLLDHADYVLAEADGSKGLPLKAHAPHEPAIPPVCRRVVLVVGADGFSRPIADAAHRPELYARLVGRPPGHPVSPEDAARVINAEGLGDCIFINKVENDIHRACARRFAHAAHMPVLAGSLREGSICLLS